MAESQNVSNKKCGYLLFKITDYLYKSLLNRAATDQWLQSIRLDG